MRLRRVLFALLILAGLGAGAAWVLRPPVVTTATVARGPVAEVVYATGVVEPLRWAKVVPMQRKRVVELCQCEGESVVKGQVLARQDDGEEQATLKELEARRFHVERDYKRMSSLLDRGTITPQAFDQIATQLKEVEARILAQKERLESLVLRSPMDGIVLRRDGQVGEIAGQTEVLFWVGQPKPLRVVAEVNEEDIPRVESGQKVLLRNEGFPAGGLVGAVAEITPKGDPVAKTFRTYLELPEDSPLRIGMTVEANVVVREKADVLLVPAEAVAGGTVYVVDGEQVRPVPVEVGVRGTRLVEVRGPVQEGFRVLSPARPDLRAGARVRTR